MTIILIDRTMPTVELILAAVVDQCGRLVDRWRAWRVEDSRRRNHVPRHSKTVARVELGPAFGRATVTYRRTRRPGRLPARDQMKLRRAGVGADPRWHHPTPPSTPIFQLESED